MLPSSITLIAIIPTSAIVIVLMFLPAIIELKRPHDAGPRVITGSPQQKKTIDFTDLYDIEGSLKFDGQPTTNTLDFCRFLPTFED